MNVSTHSTKTHSLDSQREWKLKSLLVWNIIGTLLFASLFMPLTQPYWDTLNVAFFKMINSSLRDRPTWQLFWACANHKYADWVEDVCILGFFIAYVRNASKGLRLKRVCNLIFCVLYIGLIIFLVNEVLFRGQLKISHPSPSLVVENSVRLSKEIPWMKIKDSATKSFPGDHGTTALLFGASFAYLAGWRLGLLASLYAVFLCIPRLIVGAHWLSDIVVGSGTITIFFLSWAFCSPLFARFTTGCERFFRWIGRR
jgi:membrane-associated phospholipid phosphatase